jgi:predicted protein tyrosine phosphatase
MNTLHLIKYISLREAEKITTGISQPSSPYHRKAILISILSPLQNLIGGVQPQQIVIDNPSWLTVKRFEFYDTEGPQPWTNGMHFLPSQADSIVEIARGWRCFAGIYVIHCEAGSSRSAAIAKALAEWFSVELDGCGAPRALPEEHNYTGYNHFVYKTMRDAIDRSEQRLGPVT